MWIHRKAHFRNADGNTARSKVAATVYFRPDTNAPPPPKGWQEACPHCGAAVRVAKPARGGTVVSEILPSGQMIPHPCFDRMRGKRPSEETLDLFAWQPG